MTPQDDADRTETESQFDHRPGETPTGVVVTAVAEATGQSPLEMRPLGEVVDTDALNRLFGSSRDSRSSVTVSFEYCGQHVTMTANDVAVASSSPGE